MSKSIEPLIFGSISLPCDNCIEPATHWHHQTVTFFFLLGCFSRLGGGGGVPFNLLFRRWNACSVGLRSGDWLGQSQTFHFFFSLMKPFVVLCHCLLYCTMKFLPVSWDAFLRTFWRTECFWDFWIHPAATTVSYVINKDQCSGSDFPSFLSFRLACFSPKDSSLVFMLVHLF